MFLVRLPTIHFHRCQEVTIAEIMNDMAHFTFSGHPQEDCHLNTIAPHTHSRKYKKLIFKKKMH